jgi:hypothetical protein
MRSKRHALDEIIKKLRMPQASFYEAKLQEAARQIDVSVPTYHHCKEQYGQVEKSTVKRFTEMMAK